jgi:hypothetical protein
MTGRDYSREDMSQAVKLANRGYDVTMIFRALAAKPSGRRDPGSVKYQRVLDERGRDAADAYARQTAERAVEFVASHPAITDRPSAFLRLVEIQGIAGGLPWAVYAGAGVRRALEGTFIIGERIGGLSFGLALREWSEIAGQDERATREHRDALVRLGWLRRNPNDRAGRTGRYALRVPTHIHSHGRSECADSAGRAWMAHDAFRPTALGDLGWYVLASLSAPRSLGDLSLRTGLDPDELRDLAWRLDGIGAVSLVDDGVLVRSPDLAGRLDAFASSAGTSGSLEADVERHARERAEFRRRGDVNVRAVTA